VDVAVLATALLFRDCQLFSTNFSSVKTDKA
jgi:hypothetical protein